jgi:hypothetical protein
MVPILRKKDDMEMLLYSHEKKKFFVWDGNKGLWYVGRNWPRAMRMYMWRSRGGYPPAWPRGVHPPEIQ